MEMTASCGGSYRVEGLSKKEKGLMEVINSVGIAEGPRGGYKGTKRSLKNHR